VAVPPAPVQVSVKLTAPLIMIDYEPDTDLVPDQSPLALQLSASVDDQVSVIVPRRLTLAGSAARLTVGAVLTCNCRRTSP
jgi:hypothetical protein